MRTVIAAVMAAAVVLVPMAASLAPAQAAPQRIAVQVCRSVEPGVRCGTVFPSGSPWIDVQVSHVVFPVIVSVGGSCAANVTSRYPVYHVICFPRALTTLPASGATSLADEPAGTRTVSVADMSGTVVAYSTYEIVPQSARAALAAYHGGSGYDVAGRALAEARLGRLRDALRDARRVKDTDIASLGFGLRAEVVLLVALGHVHHALADAEAIPARYGQHRLDPGTGEYLLIAATAVRACDLRAAEQAAGQAAQLSPQSTAVDQAFMDVANAKASCTSSTTPHSPTQADDQHDWPAGPNDPGYGGGASVS